MTTRNSARRNRGFTLLELLAVIVIVAVVSAAAVVGLFGAERGREVRVEAMRLAQLIELARDEAVLTSRELGLEITRDGYRFHVFDPDQRRWAVLEQRPFQARELPQFTLMLEIEQRLQLTGDEAAGPQVEPQIVIFSSGEQTPFSIEVVPPPDWRTRPWTVRSDGLSRATPAQVGEDRTT